MICNHGSSVYESSEYVKDFIRKKKDFLDNAWINDADLCDIEIVDAGYSINKISLISGTALISRPKLRDSFEYDLHDVISNEKFDFNEFVIKDLQLYVQW